MSFTPISHQASAETLEKSSQVTAIEGEIDGAGNETRTRDPDLGKIVPQTVHAIDSYRTSPLSVEVLNAQVVSPSSDLRSVADCIRVTWSGLHGAPAYHPLCHWSDLCKSRGCFWQWPQAGFRARPKQGGLDL